jgi:hypothetical protein
MMEANRAYEHGDEAKLRSILYEWETSPELVEESFFVSRQELKGIRPNGLPHSTPT